MQVRIYLMCFKILGDFTLFFLFSVVECCPILELWEDALLVWIQQSVKTDVVALPAVLSWRGSREMEALQSRDQETSL